ncbi:MAG: TetR/AcrR family transcriptional regulator [Rhizobiales bacterium]|mgnify:CR=1 FL=1|nr:TetR/AcrR family transcriptional regulator [Hyphomicrobiales bacterium]
MSPVAATLKPRKLPVQARSTVTVEALQVAAIQVLVREGLQRCTTTRVAERAGTSVGSLYQYYPNRDALLRAVLERHLEGIADALDAACQASRGKLLSEMGEALVTAYLAAKLRDPEESRALYAVAEARDGEAIVTKVYARVRAAVAAMLATAADAAFDDPETVAIFAVSAMMGPIQALLKGAAPAGMEERLQSELSRIVVAYLEASATRR